MIDSRPANDVGPILTHRDAQRLAQACPDLGDWPRTWHYEPADIDVGQKIVAELTPFLLYLLNQGQAKATVRRHRDNLWTLGGELIRLRYEDDEFARMDVKDALRQLIEGDGGPLIWPRITEAEQDSLDATCRKLHRFIRESAPTRQST
jgi:hypothetical protein